MKNSQLIAKAVKYTKETLIGAEGGHDWWHIYRVWKMSNHIAKTEKVNGIIVELGALLHDIADSKFYNGDESIGSATARKFLLDQGTSKEVVDGVCNIISHISFKGGKEIQKYKSPELDVVQDADRLDAIGAIGIARTFNYGGFKGRELYNPGVKPDLDMSKEQYKNSVAPTINHFYEKLLLLKDRMNTETGRRIATERHKFMELYLNEFYDEWEGKK